MFGDQSSLKVNVTVLNLGLCLHMFHAVGLIYNEYTQMPEFETK